jgi:hypothetical protein
VTADLAYWAHDVYLDEKAADFEVARTLVDLGDADLSRVASISRRILIDRGLDVHDGSETAAGLVICAFLGAVICVLVGMILRPEADALIAPLVSFLVVGP